MEKLQELKVKIFADGADKAEMIEIYKKTFIKGLTTNPSLMKKAGISDYREFCKDILFFVKDKPLSFEVFSDDFMQMESQALEISSWGGNVYVKIPITNTKKESSFDLIKKLTDQKVKVNVTAVMTLDQIKNILPALNLDVPSYVSVFAGRIADTGFDPVPLMKNAVDLLRAYPSVELIWASPRELLNIFQANEIGCHIITITSEIQKKLPLIGYDLNDYSLDTVKMFYTDAVSAGYRL